MKDAKVSLTIRVTPELYQRLKEKKFETGIGTQAAGESCLEAWAYGKVDEEIEAYKKFLKRAPRTILNVVRLLIDYVNVSSRP